MALVGRGRPRVIREREAPPREAAEYIVVENVAVPHTQCARLILGFDALHVENHFRGAVRVELVEHTAAKTHAHVEGLGTRACRWVEVDHRRFQPHRDVGPAWHQLGLDELPRFRVRAFGFEFVDERRQGFGCRYAVQSSGGSAGRIVDGRDGAPFVHHQRRGGGRPDYRDRKRGKQGMNTHDAGCSVCRCQS